VYPNLFCAHPPFQIDGNFGVTAAICEMLVQCRGDMLLLLPALPGKWKRGEVKGLVAKGGLIIDMKWNEKGIENLAIQSPLADLTRRIRMDGEEITVTFKKGTVYRCFGQGREKPVSEKKTNNTEFVMDYQDVQYIITARYDDEIMKIMDDEQRKNKVKFYTPTEEAMQLPFCMLAAANYTVGEKHMTRRRGTENYQLILTTGGSVVIEVEGEEFICKKGTVMLVDCRKAHSYRTGPERRWAYKHVHFTTSCGTGLVEKCMGFIDSVGSIEHYIDEIFEEFERMSSTSCYKFSNLLSNILTDLVMLHMGSRQVDEHREIIENAARYLRDNYGQKIQMGDLAKQLYISECYFIRLFKEYYGTSPYSYLVRHRVNMSKEKLIGGMSVEEIAKHCGFGHTNNFFRVFKQQTGLTPNKFRNQYYGH